MFASSRLATVAIRSKVVVPALKAAATTTTTTTSSLPFTNKFLFRAMTSLTSLPSVEVLQGFPDPKKINISDYCAGKNVILVGLPGAFTPTCSTKQVPGYIEKQEALKEAGIEEVIVYCVNDPAVMQAWAADQKIEGSFVTFVADPAAVLTKALGMEMTHDGPPSVGIIGRCKRFAIYVEDEEIKIVKVSEGPDDPAGDDDPSATLAEGMLKAISDSK